MLTEIEILEIFDRNYWNISKFFLRNRDFFFFLPESKILTEIKILDQIDVFLKILTQIKIFGIGDRNLNCSKIFTEIEIFRKFWLLTRFSKLLTATKFFLNSVGNWDIWPKLIFFEILTQIEIFKIFDRKQNFWKFFITIDILEILNQNRNFSKISTKNKFFGIFDRKLNSSKIYQNWDFRNFWQKSKFLENIELNRDFLNFWQKSKFLG